MRKSTGLEVHSQTQNKAQLLPACGHVSASSQSLRFILSLRMYSSVITSRPGSCVLREDLDQHRKQLSLP